MQLELAQNESLKIVFLCILYVHNFNKWYVSLQLHIYHLYLFFSWYVWVLYFEFFMSIICSMVVTWRKQHTAWMRRDLWTLPIDMSIANVQSISCVPIKFRKQRTLVVCSQGWVSIFTQLFLTFISCIPVPVLNLRNFCILAILCIL